MTCTMRSIGNNHSQNRSFSSRRRNTNHPQHDLTILLAHSNDLHASPSISPLRRRRSSSSFSSSAWPEVKQPAAPPRRDRTFGEQPITIPLTDVLEFEDVDERRVRIKAEQAGDDDGNKLRIEHLELAFGSDTSQQVLMAFLTFALPPERHVQKKDQQPKQQQQLQPFCDAPSVCSTDDSQSDETPGQKVMINADTLTAHKLHQRIRSETLLDKLKRKLKRLSDQLEDLSGELSEHICGCIEGEGPQEQQADTRTNTEDAVEEKPEGRSCTTMTTWQPSKPQYDFSMLEDDSDDDDDEFDRLGVVLCTIPSGLSLENASICMSTPMITGYDI